MKQIPVHSRQGIVAYCLVDDTDYDELSQYRWSFTGTRKGKKRLYVSRGTGNGGRMLIHRQIMGMKKGDRTQVDHKDGNPLNNQRSNLRKATNALNSQNQISVPGSKSSYRGVSFKKDLGKWQAYARLNGKQHHLGYFHNEQDAANTASEWRKSHMKFTEER